MPLHRTTGNRRLGASLAIVTTIVWAALPMVLKVLLVQLDPLTLTEFRFLIATACLAAWLAWRGELVAPGAMPRASWPLLIVATLGLAANYITFLVGLHLMTPATTQVLIQLGPLFLAMGGLVIFGERFNRSQWLGFSILLGGLLLFFGSQLENLAIDSRRSALGVASIVTAALTWAIYCLAQKQLLLHLPARPLMLYIFAGCAIGFAPLAHPTAIATLDGVGWTTLGLAGLATLIAYGCFSASLEHLEASRVSAVIALVPLGTMGLTLIADELSLLRYAAEPITISNLAAASIVVAGSMITALAGDDIQSLDRNTESTPTRR